MKFAICSVLSLVVAVLVETTTLEAILAASIPILYVLIILASIIEPSFWWLLGILALAACVTINIYFPEAAAERAADHHHVTQELLRGIGRRDRVEVTIEFGLLAIS